MPDFIIEFTDYLHKEFILHREHMDHARSVKKDYEAMAQYARLADYTWDVLYRYYETVLR